jgi:hypothetical protein
MVEIVPFERGSLLQYIERLLDSLALEAFL